MTSWAPVLAFSKPAIPAHAAPPRTAATTAMGQFIARQGADLVSLQEVPNTFYRDTVARLAGFPHKSRLELGKTILSRTPIEEEQVIPLIDDRSLLRITTTFEGIKLSIYGVHISWDAEGDAQAKQIIDTYLPRDLNPRKIFLGDFNDEHFATQNIILESALCDAWTDLGVRPGARTSWPATGWSGSEGHQLIDLLLYDPAGGIFPLGGEILNLAPPLSDHRPVVFQVQLTDRLISRLEQLVGEGNLRLLAPPPKSSETSNNGSRRNHQRSA